MEVATEEDTVVVQLRREIAYLREQQAFFENLGQCCASSAHTSTTGPLAHILYFNTPSSVSCRQKIEELVACVSAPANGETSPDYQPNAVQVKSLDDGFTLKVTGAVEYYVDFCVDRLGTPMQLIGEELSMDESLGVYYAQVYTEPPWDNTPAAKEDARPRRISLKCFNCDGDHHLKDCPQPRDFAKISASRQTFKDTATPGSEKRYHIGMAGDYSKKFAPGKVSDKLRKALGMTGDEYPPYISRMRDLGYPPGYQLLQTAESLVLYGEEASGDHTPGNLLRATQMNMGTSSVMVFGSKEIIYPGFNDQGIEMVDMDLDEGEMITTGISKELKYGESGSHVDYEFEEGEILENVPGMKQMKTKSPVQKERTESYTEMPETTSLSGDLKAGGETETLTQPEPVEEQLKAKKFSLDFPPGLVHDISECETSPKRWKALKKLLAEKKSRRKSKQFSFSLQ